MNTRKSFGLMVGLTVVMGLSIAETALAGPGPGGDNRSYSNITGTNIWNSTAPILDEDFPIDPELVAKVKQINTDVAVKYQECLNAIAAAEQSVPAIPPRQYLRRDPRQPYPQACIDLENLRSQAEALRAKVKEYQDLAANRTRGTW
jgi:hypothetical protein